MFVQECVCIVTGPRVLACQCSVYHVEAVWADEWSCPAGHIWTPGTGTKAKLRVLLESSKEAYLVYQKYIPK